MTYVNFKLFLTLEENFEHIRHLVSIFKHLSLNISK